MFDQEQSLSVIVFKVKKLDDFKILIHFYAGGNVHTIAPLDYWYHITRLKGTKLVRVTDWTFRFMSLESSH